MLNPTRAESPAKAEEGELDDLFSDEDDANGEEDLEGLFN